MTTTIKAVDNFTNESVQFRVVGAKHSGQEVHVRPCQRGLFSCAVPVCEDEAAFARSHIELHVAIPAKTYSIWEAGGRLRFSQDGRWSAEAKPLPGESHSEGERSLIVGGTGNCLVKRVK